MACFTTIGIFLAASLSAGASLETFRWSERPLLIFTPSERDERVGRQTTALADVRDGLEDRDIAVLIVGPRRVFTTFGRPATDADARALRRRFRVPDAVFRVVLLGKDGGVKLTADEPVPPHDLFALIDAMPMRRREMDPR